MITCLPELPPEVPPESSAGITAESGRKGPGGKVPKDKVMNDEVAKIIELLKI
jgi:hypothetical protein